MGRVTFVRLTPPFAGENAARVSAAENFAIIQRLTAEFLQQLVADGLSPCSAAIAPS